jgi:23S rRNA pseudouridine1911/1915/1917 synthase
VNPATLEVEAGAATERLDIYLSTVLGRTRSNVARLLEQGLIEVNGNGAPRPSYKVQPGDRVTIREAIKPTLAIPAPDLEIVYEDDDLMVVSKPAGLSVHPGAGRTQVPTVADFARLRTSDPDNERPGIVHRLDRDTSGLLIIAKNSEAKAYLQAAFKSREIHKTYKLLVVGRLKQAKATIKLPLGRDVSKPLQQAVVAGGRDAITSYTALAYLPGYTYVEAQPATGRTHQLRIHFAALGHPVAGDTTYGPTARPLGLKRQFLHAGGLEFTAPSGKKIHVSAKMPADLEKVLEILGLSQQS